MISTVKCFHVYNYSEGVYDNKPTFKAQIDVPTLDYQRNVVHALVELNIDAGQLVEFSKIADKKDVEIQVVSRRSKAGNYSFAFVSSQAKK